MAHVNKNDRCYTEKAPNAWHRRGTQKTGNTYKQPDRPSTDTPHRPSTKHYRKGSPGDAQHLLTQQQPCTLQHNNNPPSLPANYLHLHLHLYLHLHLHLPALNRVITRSSQPTQPAAKPRINTQVGMCRIAACNAWVSWSSDLAVMHAHQPRPPRQRGVRHACEHHCAQHLRPCIYMHCCLAQWGIYWFSRVMHAAVRYPAYATYLVPGSVLPPMGMRPLWPGTLRADSSRAHALHRVAAPACMRESESLPRHAHVPEPSRRFRSDSGDRGLRRVADSPDGRLAPHPVCPGGTRY